MNDRIWKYELVIGPWTDISMPVGARVLTVQAQGENAVLWALVDPRASTEIRRFEVVGTGFTIPSVESEYVGTFQILGGSFVGHVFEVKRMNGRRDEAEAR